MQCLILAGGLGTRMRPATETLPKALIPVDDHPFADYQLKWLAWAGVTEVVYCLGYKGEMIREYVGEGKDWGLRVRYVDEGTELLGTAGALRLAFDQNVLTDRFLMIYGDSYLPIDFRAAWRFFESRPEPAMMTIYRNQGRFDQSNVVFDRAASKVTLYEKGESVKKPKEFIDYGLSAFKRELIEAEVPAGVAFDLASVFNRLSQTGRLAGYEVSERFYETGSPQGLLDFQAYLASGGGVPQ